MFAEIFGVELAAAAEASKEKEDKKAEKTSLKEENKEVCENVEMKVDEREKPKVPVSLFEVSPGFVRLVVLSKPELDLLQKPIMPPIFKEVNENREIKETKVKGEKKAKPEEPKKEVCPPKPTGQPATGTEQGRKKGYGCDSDKKKKTEQDNNNTYQASSQSAQSFVSDKKASNQSAKSPVPNGKASNTQGSVVPSKDALEQPVKSSVADCGFNFNIGTWNGAENEGSVSNAQPPKGLTDDVKVEKCVEGQSAGKTP
ncbi:hypothetical protein [Wolbachia endosymbiont (group A) of Beris morrisii]|uniref:hypothetical protein n=1 Tax=Wolbachia endosymbiont (group A) of Beris morrisii TaxID=3066139 RepID=UPI00333FB7D0